ncbi:MAG: hypothetical protein P1U87_14500 [Verrucomicrobiales bacterium]|nr:hypothetical protein [Verrucomicrobiales bacterium]
MTRIFLTALLCLLPLLAPGEEKELRIIAVMGSGGTGEYDTVFSKSASLWREAAEKGDAAFSLIGEGEGSDQSAKQLKEAIAGAKEPALWIVLIGHGSFDTRSVKFNVRGPDFTDDDLAKWVEPYKGALAVINTASASGSFVRKLSGEERVIITATKNESEVYYTRFGKYFSEAIGGLPDADLDNDDQVSLLEGFLFAADQVAKFYETEGRLATEHALIDDNGDQLGSRSEWYDGVTPTRTPSEEAGPDGEIAGQKVLVKNEFEKRLSPEARARRDELEREVKALRRQKEDLEEDDYYQKLETLLLELAEIYRDVRES